MRLTAEEFASRVRDSAGLSDDEVAGRAATGVLDALGRHLSGSAARRVAEGLPERFALPLAQASERAQSATVEDFYAVVQQQSGIGDAEVAGAVGATLRTLVDVADGDAVRAARDQLPVALRDLLQTDVTQPHTSEPMAAGPRDPDAPKVAGPDRPLSQR